MCGKKETEFMATNEKLLEGLSTEKKETLGFLLENQAKELKDKLQVTKIMGGKFTIFNKADRWLWKHILFYRYLPIPREKFFKKVKFPPLIKNDIVSIEPMKPPSGLIFYLDYKWQGPLREYNNWKKVDPSLPPPKYAIGTIVYHHNTTFWGKITISEMKVKDYFFNNLPQYNCYIYTLECNGNHEVIEDNIDHQLIALLKPFAEKNWELGLALEDNSRISSSGPIESIIIATREECLEKAKEDIKRKLANFIRDAFDYKQEHRREPGCRLIKYK